MPEVAVPGRALLSVSGPEAAHFLQNLVTTDVDTLPADTVRPGALLSPQGKILFDFLLHRAGDEAFGLECRADVARDFLKRLTLYRLRAKVDLSINEDVPVVARWLAGTEAAPAGTEGFLRDGRFPDTLVVTRSYSRAGPGTGGSAEWDLVRIKGGVAESGRDYALGDAFPHDVSFDQNGGVSFRKGCFVGQEVVSRMQHRGTARRRILVACGASALPPTGTETLAGGKPVGTLGTVVGAQGLALARIDRVAEARQSGLAVTADGVELELNAPPYVSYAVVAEQSAPPAP